MKFSISHSCGHTAGVDLLGPYADRDRKAAWLATVPCPACAKTERDQERDQRNEQTAAQAASAGWPALTGTERQTAWATTIRADTITAMTERLGRHVDAELASAVLAVWTADALRHTEASWWIDNRTDPVRAVSTNLTPETRETLHTLEDNMTKKPEPASPDELLAQRRAAFDSATRSQERLRSAGERIRIADEMRRAAIAEMGQTYRDHRAVVEETGQREYKLDMEQGETLTFVSRRTLSTAIADTSRISDQELAQQYRDYRYDLHYGGYELHRRYPWLAGMHDARMALWEAQTDDQSDEQVLAEFMAPARIVAPPGGDVLKALYESAVNAIADGNAADKPRFWS